MKLATILNISSALSAGVGLMLCAPAAAGTFSVSGPGASLVDGVGVYPSVLPTPFASSAVVISRSVTSITSVTITGLTHTWVGDLQFVLRSPSGRRTIVFCRPGLTSSTTSDGNSDDFLGGTYTFTSNPPATPILPATGDPLPGGYVQSFGDSGTGIWPNPSAGVFTTPFSNVSGGAGAWTLQCYDWRGGNVGSFSSWTLTGTDSNINSFCFGDGSGTQCPCGNNSPLGLGRGCENSNPLNDGAKLSAVDSSGNPGPSVSVTANDLHLKSEGMMPGTIFLIRQGTATVSGGLGAWSSLYDGLDCVGGTVVRLGRATTGAGTNTFFGVAGVAGLQAVAQTLYYQAEYRNAFALFCPSATWNTTNALQICWTP